MRKCANISTYIFSLFYQCSSQLQKTSCDLFPLIQFSCWLPSNFAIRPQFCQCGKRVERGGQEGSNQRESDRLVFALTISWDGMQVYVEALLDYAGCRIPLHSLPYIHRFAGTSIFSSCLPKGIEEKVQDRPSLVAGDQRESKRRGGQVFFSSWRPKNIEERYKTGFLQQLETKENRRGGEGRSSLVVGDQRESKMRGGQVTFSSWRPKRIKDEGRTGLL